MKIKKEEAEKTQIHEHLDKKHEKSQLKHKKGKFPQRMWPMDSEKKKGPKI